MDNLISLSAVIHAKKEMKSIRLLDITASKTALEVCLNTLNINSLVELDKIKKEIKQTIQEMVKIENA